MSLIPSESLSFPDDFSRAITRARALSEAKATAALLNARAKRPRSRAAELPANATKPAPEPEKLPEPETVTVDMAPAVEAMPVVETPEPLVEEQTFVEQPALSEPAPMEMEMLMPVPIVPAELPEESPVPEKPIITKPAAVKHLTNRPIVGKAFRVSHQQDFEERPMEPMLGVFAGGLPASRPRTIGTRDIPAKALSRPQIVQPSPPARELLGPVAAPVIPVAVAPQIPVPVLPPEEIFIEPPRPSAPRQPSKMAQAISKGLRFQVPKIKLRLSRKWARFVIVEGISLAVLLPTAYLALSHSFSDPIMVFVLNALTIAAAAASGAVPIMFFAIGPTLPRSER